MNAVIQNGTNVATARERTAGQSALRHLFLDDVEIETASGLTRTVHAAEKYAGNPIFTPEPLWEGAMVPSTVLFDADDGLFKLWYLTHARVPGVESTYVSCFATSTDGLRWERPAVGAYAYEGSTHNNLCLGNTPGGMGVIKDEREADPARRFKAIFWRGGNRSRADRERGWGATEQRGFYAAVSPDGAHWTLMSDAPVLTGTGDTASLFGWDDRYQRYVAYVRPGRGKESGEAVPRRVIGRSLSEDFVRWSAPVDVLLPDADDPPLAELYYMPVQVFHDHYVGIPHVFVPSPDPFGPFWPELAASRDGIRWRRLGHQPLIPAGDPGSFDCGVRRGARGIVERGDELWLFYGGWHEDHGASRQHRHMTTPREAQRKAAAIGLATLRLDGFVSLDAGEAPGTLTTIPLTCRTAALSVNARVAAGGALRVELCDESGRPVTGLGLDDCDPLAGDAVAHRTTWQGRWALGQLKGQRVRLRFVLQHAELYSFSL